MGAATATAADADPSLQLAAQVTDDGSVLSTLLQVEAVSPYRMIITTLPPEASRRVGAYTRCARTQAGNEVAIIVAPSARRVQIAVGADVALLVDDSLCAEIARRDLLPNFARGNYAAGFAAALRSLSAVLGFGRLGPTGR